MRQYWLYLLRPIHVSWHIAALCAGVLGGVYLARIFAHDAGGSADGGYWLAIGVSLFAAACVKRPRLLLVVSLAAGASLGLWRGGIEQAALRAYAPYYGHMVRLSGLVHEDASVGRHGEWRLQLADIRIDQQRFHGKVWASVSSGAAIKRGDVVYLRGTLDEGFGSMSATMHRALVERIERPYPGDAGRRVRDWFADSVRLGLSEPQASLGLGFLTGQHSALPAELSEQLKVTGLTHIVVASGYNLTILVAFARRVFAGVSKYASTLCAGLMIGGFMMVAGFSPSMSRAGLVAGLSLGAWYWGRSIHPLVLLPFAAAITVLLEPSFLGDIGWYLSFAAFGGVLVMAPLMRSYFWPAQSKTGLLRQIMTDTLCAQLFTLPIILLVFGQLATYALLANVLVLPVVPLAMLFTFLAGVGGLIAPGVASICALPAQVLLEYMTRIVAWVASLPGSQEQLSFTLPTLVGSYVALFSVCAIWKLKTAYRFRE